MGKYGQAAEEYFRRGYNCSQSVAAAFAQEMGLSEEQALRMTAGFGAGFGRLREVCGAFSGMTFVLGTLYGSSDPAQKSAMYAVIQEMAQRFRSQNGGDSIVCRELLGLRQAEGNPRASERTAEYYKKRPCPQLVHLAADLTAEWIEQHPPGK